MSTNKLFVALLFLAGCLVGGAGAHLVVPPARAGTNPPRWEFYCFTAAAGGEAQNTLNQAGVQGWDLASATAIGNFNVQVEYCTKRPLP